MQDTCGRDRAAVRVSVADARVVAEDTGARADDGTRDRTVARSVGNDRASGRARNAALGVALQAAGETSHQRDGNDDPCITRSAVPPVRVDMKNNSSVFPAAEKRITHGRRQSAAQWCPIRGRASWDK